MMQQIDFYRTITKELGAYSVFNGIREALFYRLAITNRVPIRYSELENVLNEDTYLNDDQCKFVKDNITEGDRFRHYICNSDGIYIHYFVNMSKECSNDEPVAKHLGNCFETVVNKIGAASAIVLNENHPAININSYPKIIKHELSHAAIEYVINGNHEPKAFYMSDDNEEFIEFVCDLLPYLANPVKKENGLNKYIDDSISCFGYDAEEKYPEFISIIYKLNEEVLDSQETK